MKIQKYDIIIVALEPTRGSELKGTRPCLVIQNNEANSRSATTVVCTFSSVIKHYPHMMTVEATETNGLNNLSRLDILQIRTIDKERIHKKIGVLDHNYRPEFKQRFWDSFDMEDLFE